MWVEKSGVLGQGGAEPRLGAHHSYVPEKDLCVESCFQAVQVPHVVFLCYKLCQECAPCRFRVFQSRSKRLSKVCFFVFNKNGLGNQVRAL